MAAKGRCAGCGKTGTSCAMSRHVVDCPNWNALAVSDPARALAPEAEYERWQRDDQEQDRARRKSVAIEENEAWRAQSAGRFAQSTDITLEDLEHEPGDRVAGCSRGEARGVVQGQELASSHGG